MNLEPDIYSRDKHQAHPDTDKLTKLLVNRRNPVDPAVVLMKGFKIHACFKVDSNINLQKLLKLHINNSEEESDKQSKHQKRYKIQELEIFVNATWRNSLEEPSGNGSIANIFGKLGGFTLQEKISTLKIPQHNALEVAPDFLQSYGAKLKKITEVTKITHPVIQNKELEKLYLIEYKFDKKYIENFVFQEKLAGGLAIETHPFPHIYIPMSKSSHGALILGKHLGNNNYAFTAVQIPFGFYLEVAPNTIHGDWFFVGAYAILVAATELADAVLIKNYEKNMQMIELY